MESCRAQEHLPDPKEIIMDIISRDTDGRIHDIEIQNINSGDILNRTFFYMCRMISDSVDRKI